MRQDYFNFYQFKLFSFSKYVRTAAVADSNILFVAFVVHYT